MPKLKMTRALSEVKQTPKGGLLVEQPLPIKSLCQIMHETGISKVERRGVSGARRPHAGCGQTFSTLVDGKHFEALLPLPCLVDSLLGSSWVYCEHTMVPEACLGMALTQAVGVAIRK